MNIEEHIDSVMTRLKVIGMVKKNGRLSIRNGNLTIESDNHLQNVRRWMNNDSRDVTLMHIRSTINNAIQLTKGIIGKQVDVQLRDWTLQRLLDDMTNSQMGLINLKSTYADDATVVANLDVLLERLQANCAKLNEFLDNHPSPHQTQME